MRHECAGANQARSAALLSRVGDVADRPFLPVPEHLQVAYESRHACHYVRVDLDESRLVAERALDEHVCLGAAEDVLRTLFAVIVGAFLFGACSNDIGAQLEAAESLVAEFALTQTTGPSEVDSMTFRYVSASGLMDGDQEDVVTSVEGRFTAAGWSVVLVEPLDVSGSPANEGSRVVATKDGLAAQVAVFDHVGLNPAPLGLRWVQVSEARSSDPVGWARID